MTTTLQTTLALREAALQRLEASLAAKSASKTQPKKPVDASGPGDHS